MGTPKVVLSFDVETVGLYGEPFAIGATVMMQLKEDIVEIDHFYGQTELHSNSNSTESDLQFVKESVFPVQYGDKLSSVRELRDKFWKFYETHSTVPIVVDCGTPVEAYFLRQCVLDDFEARKWKAPYPLHELGTLLLIRGKNPIGIYSRKENESLVHNPLHDARQTARLWLENL